MKNIRSPPEVTRKRLFLETMEEVFKTSNSSSPNRTQGRCRALSAAERAEPEFIDRRYKLMGNRLPAIFIAVVILAGLAYSSFFVVQAGRTGHHPALR